MEYHRILLDLLGRDATQAERALLPRIESEVQTLEPQEVTKLISSVDNLVTIPVIPDTIKYMLIVATYTQDDPANSVVKGQLAPFFVRIDGDTVDRHREGLYLLTGDVTDLKVGTAYATNKIEIKVMMG